MAVRSILTCLDPAAINSSPPMEAFGNRYIGIYHVHGAARIGRSQLFLGGFSLCILLNAWFGDLARSEPHSSSQQRNLEAG